MKVMDMCKVYSEAEVGQPCSGASWYSERNGLGPTVNPPPRSGGARLVHIDLSCSGDMMSDLVPTVNEATENLVVRLQTLYRARRARRDAVELANSAYLKCWDAASGLAYYCNLHTGLSSWKKPLLLAARDSIEAPANIFQGKDPTHPGIKSESTTDPDPSLDLVTQLTTKDRHRRREESLAFKRKCEEEKRKLMRRHRGKIARAMCRFEKNLLDEKNRTRQERQEKLKSDNHQLLQDLYDGKKVREQVVKPVEVIDILNMIIVGSRKRMYRQSVRQPCEATWAGSNNCWTWALTLMLKVYVG
ncbi:unnamed protein product [Phytophthora fragariaefolia]|uniref:Unnamed protein product n=1 Tax=Phytophthora fragariaefolia TaxID=1490495 RepID=A0A9W6XPZ7_9STRA|nr:unnamed protein product [Phytophthora fragariaefolia]